MKKHEKPVMTPDHLAQQMRSQAGESAIKSGVLFGPERTGLNNEDISLADAICRVPLNPDFSSLNLAQAVLLIGPLVPVQILMVVCISICRRKLILDHHPSI